MSKNKKPGRWILSGSCLHPSVDPDVFFPEQWVDVAVMVNGEEQIMTDSIEDYSEDRVAQARTICARCPVLNACEAHSVEHEPEHGVWAGMTPAERRKESLRLIVEEHEQLLKDLG